MDCDDLMDLMNAALTPLIAIIATYIAWQQYSTNRTRLRMEQYDRRLHVYNEAKTFISFVIRNANIGIEELQALRRGTAEAQFLFGPEVSVYIDELLRRGVALRKWNSMYRDYTQSTPENYDHSMVVQGSHEELRWICQQAEVLPRIFKPYLSVGYSPIMFRDHAEKIRRAGAFLWRRTKQTFRR